MKLALGSRLGPYEIVAPLGAGGMGEVYAARDTRLGRTVALKVLSAEFSDDPKFKIRFEREAKAISALNHPHICALYDVGPDYLVMEHCEGTTLAARVAGRALSLAQVIEYGMQIAGALDKAHRAAIVHRDLKPSNVMITPSGVKLLDFGLAKQHGVSSPDHSTVEAVTEDGKIAGTPQYMAPEVLQGREADARSDIFALGLVLYEMASGKPAYTGSNRASIIAAILEREPPHVEAKPALDRVIQACLARDPDQRMQSANDVRLQLQWLVERRPTRWSPLALIAALLIVAIAAAVTWRFWPARPRIDVVPLTSLDGYEVEPALSSDDKRVAFVWKHDNASHVFVKFIGRAELQQLTRGDGAESHPAWSPDGASIAFCRATPEATSSSPSTPSAVPSASSRTPPRRRSASTTRPTARASPWPTAPHRARSRRFSSCQLTTARSAASRRRTIRPIRSRRRTSATTASRRSHQTAARSPSFTTCSGRGSVASTSNASAIGTGHSLLSAI